MPEFARARHGVKPPDLVPAADVESADVSRCRDPRSLSTRAPDDDDIAADRGRRRRPLGQRVHVRIEVLAQVLHPFAPERGVGQARLRVE